MLTARTSFLLVLIMHSFAWGQNRNLKFEHIGTSAGLSQSNVISIHQDSRGYMWFGTRDGLNKYDGYKITVYKNEHTNANSISNNTINDIAEDSKGNLWIATAQGLNFFDRSREKFTRFLHDPANENSVSGNNLNTLFIDKDNKLWIGSEGNGFDHYDPQKNRFTHYKTRTGGLSNNIVKKIFRDSKGELWIATDGGGMCVYDTLTETFKYFRHDPKDPFTLQHDRVWDIFEDSQHRIWVGSMGGGLHLFNRQEQNFKRYNWCVGDDCLPSFVLSIGEDFNHHLWFGTENDGLWIMNPESDQFTTLKEDFTSLGGLNNNSVWSILCDIKGNLWIGTFSGGVNLFNRDTDKFVHYQQTASQNSLSHNNVLNLYEDSKDNLWVCTDGGGLNLFNREKGTFTHFKHQRGNAKSISQNYVLTIIEAHDHRYWIGTWGGGVTVFDPAKNTYEHFKNDPRDTTSLSSNNVWVIFEDSNHDIWLGTYSAGLDRYDPKTKTFIHHRYDQGASVDRSISYNMINAIFEDSRKNFWIGTNGGGLTLFDRQTNKTRTFQFNNSGNSISNNVVNCITEDSKGFLWVGTAYGLNQLKVETGTFTNYFSKDGLPNESIFGILEDNKKNLWISTNKGISRFNPANQTFKNYSSADGLQGDEFKQAYCKSRNGALYFGGINGFNEFYPDSIRDISFNPPLVLTNLLIFNSPVKIGEPNEEKPTLPRHISEMKEIVLDYKSSVFSLEFASLNYTSPQRRQYAYMLENFDNDWNYVGTNRFATYTNLNPGRYVFKVKGLDNQGQWSDKTIELGIIITPPFYLTSWFRALVAISALSLIFLLYRIRINAINQKKRELERLVEERTEKLAISTLQERTAREEAEKARQEAEQANRAKSIFLATMSHEIRTPMNGVIGMASLLSETELNEEQQDYINTIKSSGESLLTVINDILDFSKIESGRMELEHKDFDIRQSIEKVFDLFANKASELHIDLLYQIDHNVPPQIIGDELRLKQILINLVGNAVKFTHRGEVFVGVHLVALDSDSATLQFEVRDTGIGIPKDKVNRLFKAFSQVDSSTTRKYGGTGLGLAICEKLIDLMGGSISVESEEGKGTQFFFTINTKVSRKAIKTYVYNTTAGLENRTILIVDDNETNRIILKTQLERWKYNILLAASAAEALIMLNAHTVDLIITDMDMPAVDGAAFALSAKAKFPELPIFLLSSIGDDRTHATSGLFAAVLTKPVKHEQLCARIIDQLRHQAPSISTGKSKSAFAEDLSTRYPLQILIVDDNLINHKLTGRILTKMGYQPDSANNGHEALEMISVKQYDMILMDVQMPELDGMETTRIIRGSGKKQPTIIAMTANAMEKDREECLKSGMNDYMSKPIKLEDMIAMVRKWARAIAETTGN